MSKWYLLWFVEQCDEVVDRLQLLETMQILRTDSALPDGASGGRQQLFVVGLADQLIQRIKTTVITD